MLEPFAPNARHVAVLALAFVITTALTLPAIAQTATLDAPSEVTVGAMISVSWSGPDAERDFISLDPVDAPDREYGSYTYTKEGSPLTLRAPGKPGTYVVRYHSGESGYPVLATARVNVVATTATLQVPATAEVGSSISVQWTGPNHPRDFISIDPQGAPENQYGAYKYTDKGNPIELPVPGEPGTYEVRYHLGASSYPVIGSASIEVQTIEATLDFPDRVAAGSPLSITWQGPDNPRDFISIDEVGADERLYGDYTYTQEGSPLEITVPDKPGTYVVRYHLGVSGYPVIGTKTVEVGGVTATVSVDGPVVADEPFEVTWTGPDNPRDFITIVPVGTPEKQYDRYAYTRRGVPLRVLAPAEPGPHEVRYLTGNDYLTLASAPVEVVAGTAKGSLRVFLSTASEAAGGSAADASSIGAVEVILDASGSMLQRLDGERRIELARAALLDLTGDALPAGIPFALRVFGHKESGSCRTDLEMPLGPLDRARAAATVRAVDAKNLAKTPIADSLRKVRDDLADAADPRLVILVTDGEETCGGDPAAVIEELRASGIDVRVNIVGFAIDELMVKEDFERWARLGGGRYFDAADGDALRDAVRGALATTFDVVQGGQVVATGSLGGDAIELDPGDYTVRIGGREVGTVTVVAKEETRFVAET